MANPNPENINTVKVPKIIENTKYKVRRDVLDTFHDIVPTSSVLPSFQDRILHFKVERASGKCINLSLIKLHVQLLIKAKRGVEVVGQGEGNPTFVKSTGDKSGKKGKNDKNPPPGNKEADMPKVVIPGNPLATIFKDVRIKLNGVTVSDSNGLYPYICQHLLLTKVPPVYRKAVEQSGFIYYDHEDTRIMPAIGSMKYRNVGLDPLLFKDLEIRQERYEIGNEVPLDLCVYLFTDLSCSPKSVVLPPSVSLEVELYPTIPEKSMILDKVGLIEPVVAINKAELIVPRVTPTQSIGRSISHQFMKISAQPIFIPAETTNYNGIVTFSGPIPSRLTLLFASMRSFDGNFGDNIYASVPRDVEKISFNVGGRHYPGAPITANFPRNALSEMYLRTAESLRFSLDRTQCQLPSLEDYAAREFIYSVDISSDYSSDSSWVTNPDQTGSVAVSMHFSNPTPDQTVAILISETVATLHISQNGEIEVE